MEIQTDQIVQLIILGTALIGIFALILILYVVSRHQQFKKLEYFEKGLTFYKVEESRMNWSLKTFTEATPESSLNKAEEEIGEIRHNMKNGKKDPFEYVDAIMCLFDAAGREGITADQIILAYYEKNEINQKRKWKKNHDNSYSHVK